MPGKNRYPLLGWHPPAELSAWVRDEAERRGVPASEVLNEAVVTVRAIPDLLTALRTRERGGLPPFAASKLLAELLDAAYVKGLEDAE